MGLDCWNTPLAVDTDTSAPVNTDIPEPPGGGASVSDAVYGAGWDGVVDVAPSKNAVYDKIETIAGGGGTPSIARTFALMGA